MTEGMRRVVVTPRANLHDKIHEFNLMYAEDNAISWSDCEFEWYWNEKGKLQLS